MAGRAESKKVGGGVAGLINGLQIFVSSKFEFVVVKTLVQRVEMSLNGSSQVNGRAGEESLSKRDQMKLEKAIKMMEAQDNPQIKSHKRRAHTHIKPSEPAARKQIKIDPSSGYLPSDDVNSPSSHSRDPASTTPPPPPPQTHHAPQHFNPSYSLPQGEGTLFNYLLIYSHQQGENFLKKQAQDWSALDLIGGEDVQVAGGRDSNDVCGKLSQKFGEMKERIREPFGRGHRQFGKKFLKKEFRKQ